MPLNPAATSAHFAAQMTYHAGLDLNLLILFDAIHRCDSVGQAARTLAISQSAASQGLRKLREHFGDPLFLKTRDGIRPTSRAQELAPQFAELLEQVRRVTTPGGTLDLARQQRTITIAAGDMAELAFMPRLLPRFAQLAPLCKLRSINLEGAELGRALESGEVDLCLNGALRFGGEVHQQKLLAHRFVILARRDCPLEQEIDLARFEAGRHILVEPTRDDRLRLRARLGQAGIRLNPYYTTPHWLLLPHLIDETPNSFAIVPEVLARHAEALGLGKMLLPLFALPPIAIFQFWHKRFDTDPMAKWIRGVVREVLFRNPLETHDE